MKECQTQSFNLCGEWLIFVSLTSLGATLQIQSSLKTLELKTFFVMRHRSSVYFLSPIVTDIYNSKKGILFQALNSSASIGQTLIHMVNITVQHMFFVCFCLHVFLFVPGWGYCQARCQSDHRQLLQSAHRRCFVRTSGLGRLEYFGILRRNPRVTDWLQVHIKKSPQNGNEGYVCRTTSC